MHFSLFISRMLEDRNPSPLHVCVPYAFAIWEKAGKCVLWDCVCAVRPSRECFQWMKTRHHNLHSHSSLQASIYSSLWGSCRYWTFTPMQMFSRAACVQHLSFWWAEVLCMQRALCGYPDVANPFSIILLGWPAVLISDDIYSISNYGCSDKPSVHMHARTHPHSHTHTCWSDMSTKGFSNFPLLLN